MNRIGEAGEGRSTMKAETGEASQLASVKFSLIRLTLYNRGSSI